MRTIELGPIVMIANDENHARAIMAQLIADDSDDYSLTYDECNGIFKLYDDTLDGICVMIVTIRKG